MSSFEFKVVHNMARNEGIVSGYFAVQTGHGYSGQAFIDCTNGIQTLGSSEKCIPIFTDEFGKGENIATLVSSRNEDMAGLLTFGTDESRHTTATIPVRSHTEFVCYEVGRIIPGFIGAILQLPEGVRNTMDMKHNKEIAQLHLRFGTLTLEGADCLIEMDEAVPPLPG